MKNQSVCIKAIPYADILAIQEVLERHASWQEPLNLLEEFFSDHGYPVNKKKIIQDYHACALIFQIFYENYHQLIEKEEEIVKQMIDRKRGIEQGSS